LGGTGLGRTIVYTKTGCPFCAGLIREYREQGLEFEEINVSLDPEAKKLVKGTYRVNRVPVVVRDGQVVQVGDRAGKG